ncbi:MAG: UDP-glucose 4-epimerase GalE [Candidatus Doudnabacteria bacterium]|nr:UDP-glucose 4-epimerase GalE [Candidatus Doudnabacteria bacterium]
MARILITGGAGYIGSHMVLELVKNNYEVVVLDNLSKSSLQQIKRLESLIGKKLEFIEGDVLYDLEKVVGNIDGVVHFAAFKLVPESVTDPLKYYKNNTQGVFSLLTWMQTRGIKRLIFSSTAAVYGDDVEVPTDETARITPASPYGKSKYFAEQAIADMCFASGTKAIAFRYFNVAGNELDGKIGDADLKSQALIPNIMLTALGKRDTEFKILGKDYDTLDGTTIRDFVHVLDLVSAHRLGLEKLDSMHNNFEVINLGSQNGYTIKQVFDTFIKISGGDLKYAYGDRRPGDVVRSIASNKKAQELLGWQVEKSLEDMLVSAWKWYQNITK